MSTKFPRNPKNKQVFIDVNNVKWEYEQSKNRWKRIGLVEQIPTVSSKNPGLITPEILNKLKTLKGSTKDLDLGIFKIAPGTDAYYYYFYSPDKLIDIRYQGNGLIDINVNEQKLVAYLYRYLCQGDRGKQGEDGEQGEPGLNAPNEVCYEPKYGDKVLSGEVYVPIPIGTYYDNPEITNISLRFYGILDVIEYSKSSQSNYWTSILSTPLANIKEKQIFSQLQSRILAQALGQTNEIIELSPVINNALTLFPATLLEIDINPVTGSITFINNGIAANTLTTTITYDRSIGLLRFNIPAEWPQNIIFKARQRGPTGVRGPIPNNYLIPKYCQFPNQSNVRPNNILTHFRQDCELGTLFTSYTRLDSQDAFAKITTDPTIVTATTNPIIDGNFVAVEKVAGPIKRTTILTKKLAELSTDDPLLEQWSPQPGCVTKRRYDDHSFDWIPKTDIPACDTKLTWFGPEGAKPGKYPYEIVKGEKPEEDDCCQDDFFYFPEAGEC